MAALQRVARVAREVAAHGRSNNLPVNAVLAVSAAAIAQFYEGGRPLPDSVLQRVLPVVDSVAAGAIAIAADRRAASRSRARRADRRASKSTSQGDPAENSPGGGENAENRQGD